MNIIFPQTPVPLQQGEPIDIMVRVDGKRVTVRVAWSVAAALSGGDTVDAIREHFRPLRHELERAITAHLLARGVPASGMTFMGEDEIPRP